MPDIDMLNILKINFHTIHTEQTRGSDNCCTNMHATQGHDPKEEMVKDEKCCTNIDGILKSNNGIKPLVKSKLSEKTQHISFEDPVMTVTRKEH